MFLGLEKVWTFCPVLGSLFPRLPQKGKETVKRYTAGNVELQKEVSDRFALARIPDRCKRKIPIGPAVSVNRLRRIRSGHQ
jgi:hypothetical protein